MLPLAWWVFQTKLRMTELFWTAVAKTQHHCTISTAPLRTGTRRTRTIWQDGARRRRQSLQNRSRNAHLLYTCTGTPSWGYQTCRTTSWQLKCSSWKQEQVPQQKQIWKPDLLLIPTFPLTWLLLPSYQLLFCAKGKGRMWFSLLKRHRTWCQTGFSNSFSKADRSQQLATW